MILGIDPGTSAGFALLDLGRVGADRWRYVAQIHGTRKQAAAVRAMVRAGGPIVRVVVEVPAYDAGDARRRSSVAVLAEARGAVVGACWAMGLEVVDAPWKDWQAVEHDGLAGASEDRSVQRALALGVPPGLLVGPRGGPLRDAATACCLADWGAR